MEYIGFLISLLALIYLYFKQQSFARHRREHPQVRAERPEEIEEEDALEDFMQEIGYSMKKPSTPPPAPPTPTLKTSKKPEVRRKSVESPLTQYRLESAVEKRQLKSTLESRRLEPAVKKHRDDDGHAEEMLRHPSKAEKAIKRLQSKRDLVIYQEIISKPKSLRSYP